MWKQKISYVLGDTGIELHPEYGSDPEYASGWYFVVDVNTDPDKTLTEALPLKQAKQSAEYVAKQLQRLYPQSRK